MRDQPSPDPRPRADVDVASIVALGGSRRRSLLIGGAVLLVVVLGVVAWWGSSSGTEAPVVEVQSAPATRGRLAAVLSTSGSASAALQTKLTFNASGSTTVTGRVSSVDVKVGDRVTAGQQLATLDTRNVMRSLQTAQARLESEQVRLAQQGLSLPQDAAAAAQAVASAQTQLRKAENDLASLRQSPTYAQDLATAQQAALAAQNTLNSAQQSLDVLLARVQTSNEAAAAQQQADDLNAQRSEADAALQAAAEADASGILGSATDDLVNRLTSFCSRSDQRGACLSAASGPGDLASLVTALAQIPGAPSDLDAVRSAFEAAAGSSTETRAAAFREAQAIAMLPGLTDRVSSLSQSLAVGVPSSDTLANAQVARNAAAAALTAAQAKLQAVTNGATTAELQNGQNAVNSAQAALDAALAKQDAVPGTANSAYRLQQQQVQLAEIAVQQAQDAVDDATLKAPFAGIVGQVAIAQGDLVAPTTVAITLTDPERISVQLIVSESDLPGLAAGQFGVATFDALPGRNYVVRMTGVSNIPTVTQGVVTYQAQAEVLTGETLKAQAGALADVLKIRGLLPQEASAEDAARLIDTVARQELPAPGMNANVAIVEQIVPDALYVPSSAVRRQGQQNIVYVLQADGSQQRVTVALGVSDGTHTAITSGLKEGDRVVTVGVATGATPVQGGGFLGPGGPR